MAEDTEKEEICICVLLVSFILTYCMYANRFSKAIAPVETKRLRILMLITVWLTHCLNKRQFIVCLWSSFKFHKPETGSYFPKYPTVVLQTD